MPAVKSTPSRPAPPPVPPAEPAPPAPAPAAPPTPWWQALLAALALVLAGLAAYSNSFHGDFVLDDLPAIKENKTIQQGWAKPPPPAIATQGTIDHLFQRLPYPLQPPNDGQTVTGRPLVNASFQLNYAWASEHGGDGFKPEIYHATSLAIHLLAGLALFGLVRRTLELPKVRPSIGAGALPIAFTAALLWTVHPLQTESVTYLSQRAESLMGLFYLLTLYCFVRGSQKWPWWWLPLAVLSCGISTQCKEVTATLPVMVLIFDWIFIARAPLEPLLRRWPAYAGLLLMMLPLAFVAIHAGDRGHSAGFGLGVSWLNYAMAQAPAVLNYLKLTVWPHPLALYYGESTDLATAPLTAAVVLAVPVMLALGIGALFLLWRKPMLGFLGFWFFGILAPSSLLVPVITEIAAEHRMYLSLAALAVFAGLGLWRLLRGYTLVAALALGAAFGLITFARNHDYRSGLALWADTVAKHPIIARAHENLGIMLYEANRVPESIAEYQAAELIRPNYPDCDNNLANALGALGRNEEAVKYYTRAVNNLIRPVDQATAAYNLGNALRALNRYDDAIKAYAFAANLSHYGPAYNNIGTIYAQFDKYDEAIAYYLQAIAAMPVFPQAEVNLANTYAKTNQPQLAAQHYQRAIQEDPKDADAYYHLALLYAQENQYADAAREFATTAQLVPDSPDVHYALGFCLVKLGKVDEATREFNAALKINPTYPDALKALAELRGGAPSQPAP